MWLYSRSKNFAADNHPPRRRSGGAGTARQRRQPYQSRPQAKKGSRGTSSPGAVRAGPHAAQAKETARFNAREYNKVLLQCQHSGQNGRWKLIQSKGR